MSVHEEERGLGIFFRDGIRNTLKAIDEANLDMVERVEDNSEVRAYRAGFRAAIYATSIAFGAGYTPPDKGTIQGKEKDVSADWRLAEQRKFKGPTRP